MSCSVALAGSPAFSPSRISGCKGSPELKSRPVTSPLASPTPSSSPFLSRFQRAASGIRAGNTALNAFDSATTLPSPPMLCLGAAGVGGCGSRLKRKRAMSIEIPTAEVEAGFAEAMRSDGRKEVVEESVGYAVYCKRGKKRLAMEDRYSVDLNLSGDSQLGFFGVFDGHGGKAAAEFSSEKMGLFIAEELMGSGGEGGGEIKEAIRRGYCKTDWEFLKEGKRGGACCVTALVRNGDVIVSNVGDCRAVLSRGGKSEAITSDHRPCRQDERERIESLGGFVDYAQGAWRLQGSLAVSRGIGDSHLKQWVTPEPETKIINLEAECEFLILASDGLWDKVGNQEAVDIARNWCINSKNSSPLTACKKLADLSAERGSIDDISVLIVQLAHFA